MTTEVQIIVLGKNRYDFVDPKKQTQVKGCTILAIKPVPDRKKDNSAGYEIEKVKCPYDMFSQFSIIPAIYEVVADFEKDTVYVSQVKYISKLAIKQEK